MKNPSFNLKTKTNINKTAKQLVWQKQIITLETDTKRKCKCSNATKENIDKDKQLSHICGIHT